MNKPLLHVCEACGAQFSTQASACPGCGHPNAAYVAAQQKAKQKAGNSAAVISALVLLACGGFLWRACEQMKHPPRDAEFCGKWQEYYETFCKAYPSDSDCLSKGPRRMALCEERN